MRWTDNYAAAGTCIVGCTGSPGTGAQKLDKPRYVKFDASGNLYVSDQGNNRIQKFLIEISPNCSASSSKYSAIAQILSMNFPRHVNDEMIKDFLVLGG